MGRKCSLGSNTGDSPFSFPLFYSHLQMQFFKELYTPFFHRVLKENNILEEQLKDDQIKLESIKGEHWKINM